MSKLSRDENKKMQSRIEVLLRYVVKICGLHPPRLRIINYVHSYRFQYVGIITKPHTSSDTGNLWFLNEVTQAVSLVENSILDRHCLFEDASLSTKQDLLRALFPGFQAGWRRRTGAPGAAGAHAGMAPRAPHCADDADLERPRKRVG